MKIASIVGARQNFIKCTPLSREIKKAFNEVLIPTGQHYDYEMKQSRGVDYHSGVGLGNHGQEQTGEVLKRTEEVLIKEVSDLVLVYGDTNSTLAGTLAAAKLRIEIGHIEAGLRSYDKSMPEEINRVLTDHCSDYLFCPTKTAVNNLKKEETKNGIYLTGDAMVDALKGNIEIAERKSTILDEIDLNPKEYYLATVHRAENTDDFHRPTNIVDVFFEIENLVFPSYPRTEKFFMLMLKKNAKKNLTDSRGVQKEAYISKVPCITLRGTTEWVETVEDSWDVLVGADKNRIVEASNEFEPRGEQRDVFGDGKTSKKIMKMIRRL